MPFLVICWLLGLLQRSLNSLSCTQIYVFWDVMCMCVCVCVHVCMYVFS